VHAALADAIEARAAASPGGLETAAELLARHRQASPEPVRAVPHLVTAGRKAVARAGLPEALRFLGEAERLLAAAGESGPDRLALLDAVADVQLAVADLAGLGRSLDTAGDLRTADGWTPAPAARARLRRIAALGLLVGGHPEDARQQLEVALGHAMAGDGDERAEALVALSQLAWHAGRYPEALEHAERGVAEAERVGDVHLAASAHEMAALARTSMGQPAPDPAPLGGERAAHAGPPEPFDVHLVLWERELLGDRPFADMAEQVRVYGERAGRREDTAALATAHAVQGALALEAGRWDEAEPLLRDAAERHRAGGSAFAEAFALERLGVLLTARGRHDEAMSALAAGLLVAERSDLRLHALTRLHAAMARNRLAGADLEGADSYLREALQSAARHGDCLVCETLFRRESVRVALARGHVAEAGAETIELEALAERPGGRALLGVAKLARGRVLAAQSRSADARRALEESRWAWSSLGGNYEAARALLFMARTMKSSAQGPEQVAEAERLAAEAHQALSSIGVASAES
jgi:tetratricopeptide (TPR) repeat protein